METADTLQSTSNRYDLAGELHNRFLDRLSEIARDPGKEEYDADDLLSAFLKENEIQVDEKALASQSEASWSDFSDRIEDFDTLVRRGAISSNENDYLEAIGRILEGYDLKEGPDRVVKELADLEGRIAGDRKLSETGEALLLSAASVARHSAAYWSRESQSAASIWFDPDDPQVASGGTGVIAKGVVGKDLAGAVQGGAVGSAGGTPASTLGGAIVGGIRGSAGAAIKKGVKALVGKIRGLL